MSFLLPELDFSLSATTWLMVVAIIVIQGFLSIRPNALWGLVMPLVSVALGGYKYALAIQQPRGDINGYVALATYLATALLLLVLWGICRCIMGGRLREKQRAQISAKKAAKLQAQEAAAQRAREIIAAREAAAKGMTAESAVVEGDNLSQVQQQPSAEETSASPQKNSLFPWGKKKKAQPQPDLAPTVGEENISAVAFEAEAEQQTHRKQGKNERQNAAAPMNAAAAGQKAQSSAQSLETEAKRKEKKPMSAKKAARLQQREEAAQRAREIIAAREAAAKAAKMQQEAAAAQQEEALLAAERAVEQATAHWQQPSAAKPPQNRSIVTPEMEETIVLPAKKEHRQEESGGDTQFWQKK